MAQESAMSPADTIKAIGSHWGLILTFGILTLILGIAVTANPGKSVVVVAVLVGLQFLLAGIIRLVMSFTHDAEGHRIWWIILGVLSIIVGAYLIKHIGVTIVILPMIIGILWLVQGVMEFFGGISAPTGTKGRGWEIFLGMIGFFAGIILLVYPISSIVTLAWIVGIWMIFYGFVTIFGAFQVKKAAELA